MTTTKLNLPTISGNMTADIVRDINALAEAVDAKVGVSGGLATLDGNGKVPAGQLNVQSPADASTSVKGVVQLSSATNSTSETLAATAKAVKTAMDQANAAFTSASDGKTSIANAAGAPSVSSDTFTKIASDITTGKANIAGAIRGKGGTVNDADAWSAMASAVSGLPVKRWASGTVTSSSVTTTFTYADGTIGSYRSISVSGLNFTPSVILASQVSGNTSTNSTILYPKTFPTISPTNTGRIAVMQGINSSQTEGFTWTFRLGGNATAYSGGFQIPVAGSSSSYEWYAVE